MSRKSYFEGMEAGAQGFRVVGPHQVPTNHPHGSTPEGRDWFLGFNTALEQCAATFRGERPTTTKSPDPAGTRSRHEHAA